MSRTKMTWLRFCAEVIQGSVKAFYLFLQAADVTLAAMPFGVPIMLGPKKKCL